MSKQLKLIMEQWRQHIDEMRISDIDGREETHIVSIDDKAIGNLQKKAAQNTAINPSSDMAMSWKKIIDPDEKAMLLRTWKDTSEANEFLDYLEKTWADDFKEMMKKAQAGPDAKKDQFDWFLGKLDIFKREKLAKQEEANEKTI